MIQKGRGLLRLEEDIGHVFLSAGGTTVSGVFPFWSLAPPFDGELWLWLSLDTVHQRSLFGIEGQTFRLVDLRNTTGSGIWENNGVTPIPNRTIMRAGDKAGGSWDFTLHAVAC